MLVARGFASLAWCQAATLVWSSKNEDAVFESDFQVALTSSEESSIAQANIISELQFQAGDNVKVLILPDSGSAKDAPIWVPATVEAIQEPYHEPYHESILHHLCDLSVEGL